MDSWTGILGHHCVSILLAKTLIWAPSHNRCAIFLSELTPAGAPQQTFALLTLPRDTLSFFFPLFPFRTTTIPVSNNHLLVTSFLGHHSCVYFFDILLLICGCLSYHTCIADCCVSPWRYNTKLEQQLLDLYWNICACILLAQY